MHRRPSIRAPRLDRDAGTGTTSSPSSKPELALDGETARLAAVCYGEASAADLYEEMAAIASVVVRQAKAREKSVDDFLTGSRTFAFAAYDGNPRHAAFIRAKDSERSSNRGMKSAILAARGALSGSSGDLSNGAYFWDGADIKFNYAKHPKVRRGIRFTDSAHNIYGIDEKEVPGQEWWRDSEDKKTKLRGSWLHVFESTAAYGGTAFWRYTQTS